MALIQSADAAVGFFADRFVRQDIPGAADHVTQAVAAKCVHAQEKYVGKKDDRADADAKMLFAVRTYKPEPSPGVIA